MKNVKFTADVEGAKKKNKVIKGTGPAVRYQLTSWGSKATKTIIRNVSGGIIGKYKGGVRTGQLRRNIKFKIRGSKTDIYLEIGSWGVKYARILERGGTIRPKRVQYLTIPFPGVKGRARNYSNSFVFKSKKGNLILAQKKMGLSFSGGSLSSSRGALTPLFVLKKSVDIPEFRWLSKSVAQERSLLNRMMAKQELLKVAERLT